MLYDYKVGIYTKGETTKVGGIAIPSTLSWIKDIDCDMQSYSKELLLKNYGYDIEVNKRFFMDFDPNIKIGTVLYYTNSQNIVEKYEVKKIPWEEPIMEVICLGIS
ncbi:MAG TPA: hypothetical protein DEF42_17105 [Desulfosporosinus sp.]|nr:hypothetical protein [Desulfosporosinus sp.]